jgi:UrcA family protein
MSMQTAIAAIGSVAATLALCALTPPTFAATPEHENAAEVRYQDLDLKTADGKAELNRRIEKAARTVCGLDQAVTTGSRIRAHSQTACYRNALRQIEPQFARLVDSNGEGA